MIKAELIKRSGEIEIRKSKSSNHKSVLDLAKPSDNVPCATYNSVRELLKVEAIANPPTFNLLSPEQNALISFLRNK